MKMYVARYDNPNAPFVLHLNASNEWVKGSWNARKFDTQKDARNAGKAALSPWLKTEYVKVTTLKG